MLALDPPPFFLDPNNALKFLEVSFTLGAGA